MYLELTKNHVSFDAQQRLVCASLCSNGERWPRKSLTTGRVTGTSKPSLRKKGISESVLEQCATAVVDVCEKMVSSQKTSKSEVIKAQKVAGQLSRCVKALKLKNESLEQILT